MKKRFAFCMLVVLIIVAGVLLLASCSRALSPAPSDMPTAQAKPAASPTATKPYGELKVGMGGIWSIVVEPAMAKTALTFFGGTGSAVFDSLVHVSPEGQLVPGLAERWEMAPDGTSQTFYIRKGVRFHDGSNLTGADVKFSIERFMSPQATSSEAPTMRNWIAGVDLKDDYTVVVRLKKPLFEILGSFAIYTGAGAVVPKKYIEEKGEDSFTKNLIGSGPWKVVKQETGSRIELEANESYWGEVPKFQKLTILYVAEEATKVAMLRTGELDIAQVAPDSLAGLKAAGLRIINHYGGEQYFTFLFYDMANPTKYAMGDIRVRKALSVSVNRQEMVDKLFGGAAEPGYAFLIPKTGYFYDPNVLKPDPYDLEGAKKLLAEAGRPNGFNGKLWDYGVGGMLSMLDQVLEGYWRRIGVNMEIVPIEYASLRTKITPNHSPEIWDTALPMMGTGGALHFEKVPDWYRSSGPFKNINNPELDALIDKVPMTADLAEKKRLALQVALMGKEEYHDPTFLDILANYALGSKVGSITAIKGMVYLGPILQTATHAK